MKNVLFVYALLAIIACPTLALADDNDYYGCFETVSKCVSMSSKWKGDEFVSRYTNNCSGRIYIKICNERSGGRSAECGQLGLEVGQSKNLYTDSHATGRYSSRWVGARKASYETICARKTDDFHRSQF